MKYRKKPIIVEAIKCKVAMMGFAHTWKLLPEWLVKAYDKGGVVSTPDGIYLPTPEGSMLAQPEDWIICGVNGEVYPCKPDIFAKTYDLVEETEGGAA